METLQQLLGRVLVGVDNTKTFDIAGYNLFEGLVDNVTSFNDRIIPIPTADGAGSIFTSTGGNMEFNKGSLFVGQNYNKGYFMSSTGDFHASGTSDASNIPKYRATSFGIQNYFVGDRANGSFDSPTALLANDHIVSFLSTGYHGTGAAVTHAAEIKMLANENWDASHKGTRTEFWIINDGDTTQTKVISLLNNSVTITGRLSTTDVANIGGIYSSYDLSYDLQVGTETGNHGIVIRAGNTSIGKLSFDKGANGDGLGRIWYNFSTNNMEFYSSPNGSASSKNLVLKSAGVLNYPNAPTSASGLVAGDIYSNAGILTLV